MTYKADEESVEDSQPREAYEFILPAVTYRVASGLRDITINGQTFRATTIQRTAAQVQTASHEAALEIPMLVTHALPQRYLRGGIPPRVIDVNVYRKQLRSDEYQTFWIGRVISCGLEKNLAKFLVPSRTSDALQRRIPTITEGRDCAHVLYQSGCNADENTFTVHRTVLLVDGATVTLSSAPDATDDWAKWGEIVHLASGERSTIKSQIGAVIEMQLPIVDMQAGDAVDVRAGCSHDVDTCLTKFGNQVHYGGSPQRSSGNPFVPFDRGLFSVKRFGGG